MLEAADADGWRVVAYLVVVGLALLAFGRERRSDLGAAGWPTFWLLSAGLLFAMAVGRAGDVGTWLADLMRDRAVDQGWYAERRSLQATVVAVVGGAWLVTVAWACWRIPERRRRYLPASVAMITIGAFAAVRIVSLHQIDAVLHRIHIAGMRFGTWIELGVLAVVAVLTFWSPLTQRRVGGRRRRRRLASQLTPDVAG